MQKHGEWLKGLIVLVAGLVMATACAGQEPGDETGREPLAELVLDDGSLVQFMEASPGAIMIVQEAPTGVQDVTSSGLSAVALYERLAPGEGVPVVLVEAQARVELAHASRPPHVTKRGTEASLTNNTTFENTYCSGSWDVIHCRLDRNSGFWAQYNSTDAAACTVSSDVGTITLRLLVEGDLEISRDVLAGHTITATYDSGLFNDQVRCETINVGSTDRYDLGFRFNIN
jgi:hypothetical protein